MSEESKSIRVIGIGNPDRGDDAVGREVVIQARDQLPEQVSVLEHSGEVSGLMDCMEGAEILYLVDAAAMGLEPGSVRLFDASTKPLPALRGALSSHAMGLSEAVELARSLDMLPPVCKVLAVEAATFEAGHPLSQPVAQAVPEVVRKLVAVIGKEAQHA
ncbi:hydrogenase maturation protease [Marinobacteraceae bacterium S3BR75-40.1]